MRTPSFTADSALYRATRSYAGALSAGRSSGRLVPQMDSTCGACTCDAGKCCYQSAGECRCYSCVVKAETFNHALLS